MFRRIIFILTWLSCWFPLAAAHLKGGYIEYKYLGPAPGSPGNSKFRITVYQYLDCASAGGQIDTEVYLGAFDAVTNSLVFIDFIPLGGTKIIQRKSFGC